MSDDDSNKESEWNFSLEEETNDKKEKRFLRNVGRERRINRENYGMEGLLGLERSYTR